MNGQGPNMGGRIIRGLIVVIIGVVIWYSPMPAGVKPEAWHLLAIFVATIFGLILSPLPMGAVVLLGVMMTALTGILKIGADAVGLRQQHGLADRSRFFDRPGFHHHGPGQKDRVSLHQGFWPEDARARLCHRGQRASPCSGNPLEHGPGRGDPVPDRPFSLQHVRF